MKHLSALEAAHFIWGRSTGRRVMVFIRAAFDSSQDHPSGVSTVAGYIADAETWQSIEEPWNAQLALAGLTQFHLKEIKKRFGKDYWLGIVRPFAAIIAKSKLRSVTASLKDSDWAEIDHDSAYLQVCPRRELACLDLLWGVLAQERSLEFGDEPLAVVFDNDWGNRDAIVRNHDAWCERTGDAGFNIFLKGGVPWDCVPLQAADLVAGLLRQNPFSLAMLNDDLRDYRFDSGELSDVSGSALHTGRGAMWSRALGERIEAELSKHRNRKPS